MRSGRLRHRIELQRDKTDAQDDYGQPVEGYCTQATRWAEVTDLAGRELAQAQQTKATATVQVRMRYWEPLTPQHRIKFGNRLLDINHVANPDGRNREHLLICSEAVIANP